MLASTAPEVGHCAVHIVVEVYAGKMLSTCEQILRQVDLFQRTESPDMY